jgi:hypothetical protein
MGVLAGAGSVWQPVAFASCFGDAYKLHCELPCQCKTGAACARLSSLSCRQYSLSDPIVLHCAAQRRIRYVRSWCIPQWPVSTACVRDAYCCKLSSFNLSFACKMLLRWLAGPQVEFASDAAALILGMTNFWWLVRPAGLRVCKWQKLAILFGQQLLRHFRTLLKIEQTAQQLWWVVRSAELQICAWPCCNASYSMVHLSCMVASTKLIVSLVC